MLCHGIQKKADLEWIITVRIMQAADTFLQPDDPGFLNDPKNLYGGKHPLIRLL
jgi:hypothetical protein